MTAQPGIVQRLRERAGLLAETYGEWDPNTNALLLEAAAAIEAYRAGLTEIAAYNDISASENLKATGSYSAFDEPGSVETARALLERDDE